MIRHLPGKINLKKLSKRVTQVLDELLTNPSKDKETGIANEFSSVLKVRTIGQYDKLYSMCKALQKLKNKHRDATLRNEMTDSRATLMVKRATIEKTKCITCCSCKKVELDEENYYDKLIMAKKKEIRHELKAKVDQNSGIAFIIFRDKVQANDFCY